MLARMKSRDVSPKKGATTDDGTRQILVVHLMFHIILYDSNHSLNAGQINPLLIAMCYELASAKSTRSSTTGLSEA